VTLFQAGDFTLRSGRKSGYKIECDALTPADWEGIAAMVAEEGLLPPFSAVSGVPRGGLPFANALARFATRDPAAPVLICEDVVTTGASMERWRRALAEDPQLIPPRGGYIGVCFIARGKCPDWVTPVLQQPTGRFPRVPS
jgi:orotate phosphoribosyltransferase